MPKRKAEEPPPPVIVAVGVEEGQEVILGSEEWGRLEPRAELILEFCLRGTSFGVPPNEEWILEAAGLGWRITGQQRGGCRRPTGRLSSFVRRRPLRVKDGM
jgi:hypothetical protein